MKSIFKLLFFSAFITIMYSCEAELAPIQIKPDPAFDKTGLFTVNTISIYDEQDIIVNISRNFGLSKELDLNIKVDEQLLTEYNTLNGTNFKLMPAEYYDFPSTILLNQTDKVVELPVVIKPNALASEGLSTANNYVLPLSLCSSSVEIQDNRDAAQVLILPNIALPTIQVKIPEVSSSLNFIRDVLIPQTIELEATSNFLTIDASKVTYKVDKNAVTEYNLVNNVNYQLLPSEYYNVNDGELDPLTMTYKTSITFNCSQIESDDIYILPLSMESDDYQIVQKNPIYVFVQLNTLKMWIEGGDEAIVNKSGKGNIKVVMNAPINSNQPVIFKVDNSLVDEYNNKYNTSFKKYDTNLIDIPSTEIIAGENEVNVPYQIDLSNLPFDGNDSYLFALVLDESNLFDGTNLEKNVIYVQPFRTLVGTYVKEIWGDSKSNRVTAPEIYLAGKNGWPASLNEKAQKYCINYNKNWSGGVIHFNILDESVEGYPNRKKLGDFIDRGNDNNGRGQDQVVDEGSWVDLETGIVHFNLKVLDSAYKDTGGFPIQCDFLPMN